MAVNGIEDMNGDLFGDNLVGLGDEGDSLEPSDSSGNQDQDCNICDNKLCNPRVLSCLHVFCESCLEKLLLNDVGESLNFDRALVCPACKQETKVSDVSSLPPDYILTNLLDVTLVDQTIVCTSCKSKEQAVARCSDCSHFLCPHCTSAHEFMRCFENHTVVPFDAIRNSKEPMVLHKPIFCEEHNGEGLLYYCHICEEAVCHECTVRQHKAGSAHQCERVTEAEAALRRQLLALTRRASSRVDECQKTTDRLEDSLADLQKQRDDAKAIIVERYHSFKTAIDMAHDRAMQQLESLHSERELKVMEMFNTMDKTIQKIENACKFTARLLQKGDGTEIALLKKTVANQILFLINDTPKPAVNYLIEFDVSQEKIDNIITESFGKFKTEVNINDTADSGIGVGSGSINPSPPTPLPSSMGSSFEDFSLVSPSPLVPQSPLVPSITPSLPTLPEFTEIAEYNLQRLVNLQKDGNPNAAPSQQLTLSDLLTPELSNPLAYNNLQALVKLNTDVNGVTNHVGSNSACSSSVLSIPSSSPRPNGLDDASMSSTSSFVRSTKATPMHIRHKFGQLGSGKGHFNSPHGFCLGNEEDIIVADTNNHRISVFDKAGTFKFQFGTAGKEEGQLWYPRKVAVMRNSGKFVVCDRGNERSRMQIFTKCGHFVKKIAVRYIDIVAGLAVTQQGHIVAVDSVTPTVFVISENGDLLSWFDCSECMREPSDIAINGKEFYVCDFKGHCVVVFNDEGKFLRRIGCENITNFPNGIDVSDAGDVLIGDSHGNKFHVAVFSREGSLVTEFECPYVKVSRCCGLKITSEGYIVTLAKNNHHVLILNTLYIT